LNILRGARPSPSPFGTSRSEHFPNASGGTPTAARETHAAPHFTRELGQLHPDNPANNNTEHGIRQQRHVLRAMGLLIHVERGAWRLL